MTISITGDGSKGPQESGRCAAHVCQPQGGPAVPAQVSPGGTAPGTGRHCHGVITGADHRARVRLEEEAGRAAGQAPAAPGQSGKPAGTQEGTAAATLAGEVG